MIAHAPFQITKVRDKRFDAILHTPFLDRSEAEHFAAYYLLRNLDVFCYLVLGVELLPFQSIIIRTLVRKPFPMLILTRGGGKSFCLGVYAALRACITPGSKIVMVGANRRQSRFIFQEATKIYYNSKASLFRNLVPKPPNDLPEASTMIVRGTDVQSSIVAIPLAAGDRIRGIRSSVLLVDEFAIIPEDVFNTVLKPTAAVSLNPVEKVKRIEKERELINAGVIEEMDMMEHAENQVVVSSSASYQFTFFYKLYKQYKANIIDGIQSEDPKKIKIANKYAIIQMGYESIAKLAPGYLDEGNVRDSKASLPSDKFLTEYGAQFVSDSGGHFPRSLLESRQLKMNESPIVEIVGSPDDIYILGIDPSTGEHESNDWFAIVVFKINLTNKTVHMVNASASTGKGWPYYVKLVRTYIKKFNPRYIVVDSYGGGTQMSSLLCSEEYTDKENGERTLIRIEKDDLLSYAWERNQIVRMNTPNAQYNEQSNTNFKSMLEHGNFWFAAPINDDVFEKLKTKQDEIEKLEEASEMIEEAKNQISLIVGQQGTNGLTTFGMPESLGKVKKKERVRKDLYSATLLAAWGVKEYIQISENNKVNNKVYNPTVTMA